MKTRFITLLSVCAVIAGAALLSGCSKSSFSNYGGQPIRFMTTSSGSASTKTVYGLDNTAKTMQALDWVDGDVITIASPQAVVQSGGANPAHASNYVVAVTQTGTAADVESKGTVANEGSNGLMWLDSSPEGGYDFYAIYPKSGNDISLVPESGLVTATVPASQPLNGTAVDKSVTEGGVSVTYKEYKPDMKYAFMTAANLQLKPTSDNPKVQLEFTPAFTAFEFNVASADEDPVELTGFEILSPSGKNDKLAGKFTMTAGNLASVAQSATTNSIVVDMSSAHQTVTNTQGLTFTVFAIPVKNTDPLRLRFTSTDGASAKTSWIDMKYSDDVAKAGDNAGMALQFEAGHKYRINMLKLPSSQWKISIAPVFEDWVDAKQEVVIYI